MNLAKLLRNILRGLRSSAQPIPLPENEPGQMAQMNEPPQVYVQERTGGEIMPPDKR